MKEDTRHYSFGISGDTQSLRVSGWSEPEDEFTWSLGKTSRLAIPFPAGEEEAILILKVNPFLRPPRLVSQLVVFLIRRKVVSRAEITAHFRLALFVKRAQARNGLIHLDVDYPTADAPASFGESDKRVLALAWTSVEVLGRNALSKHLAQARSAEAAAISSSVRRMNRQWAEEEMAPWAVHPAGEQSTYHSVFSHLNKNTNWAAIFRFTNQNVELLNKPDENGIDPVCLNRAQCYLRFFEGVASKLGKGLSTTICVCVADLVLGSHDLPIFPFQKSIGEPYLLLPDIEFLQYGFYEKYTGNELPFDEKRRAAVFAGATTGGPITAETATANGTPRLQAADYFSESLRVDFRLPEIVQCVDEEAKAILREKSFCKRPRLSWEEQLRYRFLISIDGNGASCSRVVRSLLSHSVLLKYSSDNELFYFKGLEAYKHFVPIVTSADVEKALDEEARSGDRFRSIAAHGREFAIRHLNREAVEDYMCELLTLYAARFPDYGD